MQFCVLGQHTEFIIAVSGQTPLILKSLPRISNALTSSTSITEFISFSVKQYILSDWPFCMSSSFLSISVEMRIVHASEIYILIQLQILNLHVYVYILIILPLPLETSCSFLPFISKSSISKMRVAPFGIESLGGSSPYALSYNGINTHHTNE